MSSKSALAEVDFGWLPNIHTNRQDSKNSWFVSNSDLEDIITLIFKKYCIFRASWMINSLM